MLLERFKALRPEKFDGIGDPWKTKQWLREMELIFDAMECNDQDKRHMAVFQLTFTAVDWWESEKATLGDEDVRRMT